MATGVCYGKSEIVEILIFIRESAHQNGHIVDKNLLYPFWLLLNFLNSFLTSISLANLKEINQ